MAKYFIPDIYKNGFRFLIELDQKSIQQIGERISAFPIGKNPQDFYEFMKSLGIPNIEEISRTIYSFANLLLDSTSSYEAIAEGLLNAYKSDHGDNKELDGEKEEVIDKLTFIFKNSKSVKLSYKALSLLLDVPAIYRTSSIVTDIRIVFNEDIEDSSRSAIITQQLKLLYLENSTEKSFYLSLDKADLEELREQIDRALKKELLMRKDYSETFSFLIKE